MAKSPKSKTKSGRKRKTQTKAGTAGTRADSKQSQADRNAQAAGRRDDRRDRQEVRVATAHGTRRHRRRAEEEARARCAVREGRSPRARLPHRGITIRRFSAVELHSSTAAG
jgi:hypothetical protein